MKLNKSHIIWVILVILSIALSIRDNTPKGNTTEIPTPTDSITSFGKCMGWKSGTVNNIKKVPHYMRRDTVKDTVGYTNQKYIWVSDRLVNPWPVFKHEWIHVYLNGDPRHIDPMWQKGKKCGSATQFSILIFK